MSSNADLEELNLFVEQHEKSVKQTIENVMHLAPDNKNQLIVNVDNERVPLTISIS